MCINRVSEILLKCKWLLIFNRMTQVGIILAKGLGKVSRSPLSAYRYSYLTFRESGDVYYKGGRLADPEMQPDHYLITHSYTLMKIPTLGHVHILEAITEDVISFVEAECRCSGSGRTTYIPATPARCNYATAKTLSLFLHFVQWSLPWDPGRSQPTVCH